MLTAPYWPDRPRIGRPFKGIEYVLVVLWDIVVANVQVAAIILFKRERDIHSRWVVVPLELTSAEAITVLAGTITMTPGTVSVHACRRWGQYSCALPAHRRCRCCSGRNQDTLRTAVEGDFPMIEIAIMFTAGCYSIAMLLDLWRIAKGPHSADRILALDTMVINASRLFGAVWSVAWHGHLARGGHAGCHGRICLNRRLLPLPFARRHHRVSV